MLCREADFNQDILSYKRGDEVRLPVLFRGEAALRMLRCRLTHVLRKSLSKPNLHQMSSRVRSFRSFVGCPRSKSRPELVRYVLGATENARGSIWGAREVSQIVSSFRQIWSKTQLDLVGFVAKRAPAGRF